LSAFARADVKKNRPSKMRRAIKSKVETLIWGLLLKMFLEKFDLEQNQNDLYFPSQKVSRLISSRGRSNNFNFIHSSSAFD
jgi:hypothetical protein